MYRGDDIGRRTVGGSSGYSYCEQYAMSNLSKGNRQRIYNKLDPKRSLTINQAAEHSQAQQNFSEAG